MPAEINYMKSGHIIFCNTVSLLGFNLHIQTNIYTFGEVHTWGSRDMHANRHTDKHSHHIQYSIPLLGWSNNRFPSVMVHSIMHPLHQFYNN